MFQFDDCGIVIRSTASQRGLSVRQVTKLIKVNIDMALENLNCISGILFYQVISELIWPYKT